MIALYSLLAESFKFYKMAITAILMQATTMIKQTKIKVVQHVNKHKKKPSRGVFHKETGLTVSHVLSREFINKRCISGVDPGYSKPLKSCICSCVDPQRPIGLIDPSNNEI